MDSAIRKGNAVARRDAQRPVITFTALISASANTAWAFATLGQPDAQLCTALAREKRLDQCL